MAALLLSMLQIAAHAYVTQRDWIDVSTRAPAQGVEGKALWGGTIPEYDHPPAVFLDPDSYTWNVLVGEMVKNGDWRLRRTSMDNVPYGREVKWDSGVAWMMLAAGRAEAAVTGRPLAESIASASVYVNPALMAVVLCGLAALVVRRLGTWATAVGVVYLAASGPVLWAFGYAHPGHHGLHSAAALALLGGIIAGGGGFVRAAALGRARWAFRIAGIGAGVGMWVGATQQVVVIGGAVIAAMVGAAMLVEPDGVEGTGAEGTEEKFEPALWRTFGVWGAVASLGFFLLEAFPDRMGMHLEVNHPLYAACLLAGGEAVARIGALRRGASQGAAGRDRIVLSACLLVVAMVPAALALGPAGWHVWHDPYIRRMHDFIGEFQPMSAGLHGNRVWALALSYGAAPLMVPLAALALLARGMSPGLRMAALACAGTALATGVMTVLQVRWQSFFALSACMTGVTLAAGAGGAQWRSWARRSVMAVGLACLAGPPIVLMWLEFSEQYRVAARESAELASAIASRDVALNLKRYAEAGETVRVMSGPGDTPALMYFGGVPGTSALYWENGEGVRDAALFFADRTAGFDAARRIARERGITHVIVADNPGLAEYMSWIATARLDRSEISETLAFHLSQPLADVPGWLEPLPYYGSPNATRLGMRMFRVVKERL
jgi:hypothetical protein